MAIYQEKNKNKWTKDGRSWYFRVYYTDLNGIRKQKVSKMFKTKQECKSYESEFILNVNLQTENKTSIIFNTVYVEWLDFKKQQIKSSTYYGLKKVLNKNILSYFKNFKMSDIKLNNINIWIETLNNTTFSINYKNSLIGYLKEILNYAKDIYSFDNRIITKIQKFKNEEVNIIKKKDSEINFWTLEEFNTFINIVDNELYNLIFTFLYYTGLRKGEMMVLNWNDINFNNKTLNIDKTLVERIEGKKYIITTPKTNNSIRAIDLSDKLVILLKQHYQTEQKIYGFKNNMFVFGNVNHISSTTLARQLNKYINKADIKKITPHGFRHSHASLLINLGCDAREVAERLGDTVQMVENTYIHIFPSKKKNAIQLLNNL